mmetsp:Transcript_35913/g.75617  ORF Transcript_35913/g.75617 Transcript_35913/m.75617 type:complete len:91 (-) Transcript_35913:246-518(-)
MVLVWGLDFISTAALPAANSRALAALTMVAEEACCLSLRAGVRRCERMGRVASSSVVGGSGVLRVIVGSAAASAADDDAEIGNGNDAPFS